MQKFGEYNKWCERCGERLNLLKPLNVSIIVSDNAMCTHVMCNTCLNKLTKFLDGVELGDKHIHIPYDHVV